MNVWDHAALALAHCEPVTARTFEVSPNGVVREIGYERLELLPCWYGLGYDFARDPRDCTSDLFPRGQPLQYRAEVAVQFRPES